MTIDRLLPGEGAWGILFSNILGAVAMVLNILLDTYFWIVIIAAALTWIRPDPYNPIVRVLRSLTEPVFLQGAQMAALYIRGGIDFSPVVVIVAIWLINGIVWSRLGRFCRKGIINFFNLHKTKEKVMDQHEIDLLEKRTLRKDPELKSLWDDHLLYEETD